MIRIQLENIGKKFGSEWIFRNLSLDIPFGDKMVILGGNGSGKSTLLQLISGFVSPSTGKILFLENGSALGQEEIHRQISLASPYLQLIEDFSALELVEHLEAFKKFLPGLSNEEVLDIAGLSHIPGKCIRQYSSGMKQRLRLALAVLADTPVVLLDEPLSNLDASASRWYSDLITRYCDRRTVVVCSNAISGEHFFCTRAINVMDYKTH